MFGAKRDEVEENVKKKNCIRSFTVYTFHQTLLRRSVDDDELGRTLTYTKF
jgi:hypothetical protein